MSKYLPSTFDSNVVGDNTALGGGDWTIADFQKLLAGNQKSVLGESGFNSNLGSTTEEGGFSLGNAFGKDGWGSSAIGAFNGLAQSYLGLKQLGLAKDTLDFQKKSYATNLGNEATTVNGAMEDVFKRQMDAQGKDYSGLEAFKKDRFVSGSIA